MKHFVTTKRILAAASVALCITAFNACTKEEMSEPAPVQGERKLVEMTFAASEAAVKSTFAGNRINWEEGDKVAIYDGTARREFSVVSVSEGTATISGLVSEDANEFYAVYPYSAARETLPSGGKINVCLPDVQTLASGKCFDEDAFVMVGSVDGSNHISFRNIVSLLKLNIPDGVTSVTVKGYAAEGISGAATATAAEEPAVSTLKGSSPSVILKPAGETFDAGEHYVALLPVTFATGFKVVYQNAENNMSIKKTTAEVTFPINGAYSITAATASDKLKWIPNPLMSEDDLLYYVQNQAAYDGETAKIGTDISLTEPWEPVDLTGTLDGQGYTISGLNVNKTGGLGAMCSLETGAVLKNLTVEGDITYDAEADDAPSGLVGHLHGTMYNVINKTNVTATSSKNRLYVGGLAGYVHGDGCVIDCENAGNVTIGNVSGLGYAGGVAGVIYSISGKGFVQGCVNSGTVKSTATSTNGLGGVVGVQESGETVRCVNKGKLEVPYMRSSGTVGGIVGLLFNNAAVATSVCQCEGAGTMAVTATEFRAAGGIVGGMDVIDGVGLAEITECKNRNDISITTSNAAADSGLDGFYLGGILGSVNAKNASAIQNAIKDCVNSGNISVTATSGSNNSIKVGGICGNTRGPMVIEGNENVAQSVNLEVSSAKSLLCSAGGIIGETGDPWNSETTTVTIKGNVNRANVLSRTNTTETPAGGIIGYAFSPVTSSENENYGDIERAAVDGTTPSTGSCFAGGLVGFLCVSADSAEPYQKAYFTNDMTVGNIKSYGRAGIFFGGMRSSSYTDFSFDNCSFAGRLTSPHSGYDLEMDADNWNDKNAVADGGYLWGFLKKEQYTFTTYKPVFKGESSVAADHLTAWQNGYLDIHHISTGRGNCTFMILPDGTTMMVDAGDSGRTADSDTKLECMPDATRTPGEWIVRYVSHFLDEAGLPSTSLDHLLVTHFHNDHLGVANTDYPVSPDGYYMTGSIYVGSTLDVRNFVDRGYPTYDFPYTGYFDGQIMMRNYFNFINSNCNRVNEMAAFEVGSSTQFALNNPADYPTFGISNVYCNGLLSDSGTVRNLVPSDAAQSELKDENLWSAVINVKYGDFDYHTGGDILVGDAVWSNIEDAVGKVIGETDVMLCNHHSCDDAMSASFLEATTPQACVIPAWETTQPGTEALGRMSGTKIYAAGPVSDDLGLSSGHVVLRVYEGGSTFQIFVLDDSSTDYKLIGTSEIFTSK